MRVFVSFLSVEFTRLLGRLFMFLPLCLAVLFSGVTLDKACPYGLQRIPASAIRAPIFRHEQFPIQVNMVIGNLPHIPSWQEQHQFAKQHYGGVRFISEDPIDVLGIKHYTMTLNLGGILPTKKYSIVLLHPKRNVPIEFVFTVSIYNPVEFKKLIEFGDNLVKSFRWL
jgi:hypothetical protein